MCSHPTGLSAGRNHPLALYPDVSMATPFPVPRRPYMATGGTTVFPLVAELRRALLDDDQAVRARSVINRNSRMVMRPGCVVLCRAARSEESGSEDQKQESSWFHDGVSLRDRKGAASGDCWYLLQSLCHLLRSIGHNVVTNRIEKRRIPPRNPPLHACFGRK